MANFSVKISETKNIENQFEKIETCLAEMADQIEGIRNSCAAANTIAFARIQSNLKKGRSDISNLRVSVSGFRVSLDEVMRLYEETEKSILGRGDMPSLSTGGKQEDGSKREENLSPFDQLKEKIRQWLENYSKQAPEDDAKQWMKLFTKSNGIEGEGLVDSILGYFDDLEGFFDWWVNKKGQPQGMSHLCDLAETSGKLWNAFYKYFESKDVTGIFKKEWGKKAAGVNLAGSVFGMFSDMIDAFTSDADNAWDKGSDFLNAFKGVVKVGASAAEYDAITTHAKTGPIKLWKTFANMILSTLSQGAESIGTYSSDGRWTLTDTAATSIEASVSGLDAGVSGIISLATLGLIDADTLRKLYNIPTAKEISSTIEKGATARGEEIGRYILDHPELRDAYTNGNAFQKCMSFFTASYKCILGI